MKQCTKCKIHKSKSLFSKASREKDGLQHRCKECNKIQSALYRQNNVEKERIRHALYHGKNKDSINKRVSQWQKDNKEKCRERAKRFYSNNTESEKERHKKWVDSNPNWKKQYAKQYRIDNAKRFQEYEKQYIENNKESIYLKNSNRRARKKMAFVKWANSAKIKALYMECIRKSKETGIEHHVDHIIPLTHSLVCGLHNEFNLQILTAKENLIKHNKFVPG